MAFRPISKKLTGPIRDRVFGRIDPIAQGGEEYRLGGECPNITVFRGTGQLVDEKTLEVSGSDGQITRLSGRHIVWAQVRDPLSLHTPALIRSPSTPQTRLCASTRFPNG